ncbi:hypothetical protein [Zunongwangia endophytica]|uniref:Uncharacterized protein n=1 Tax=Zunongwangia endophytica TaxID=1808945 RepID=A0ABV8HCK0_9FLAO|nr:hypothetical protein [Zunongwangia endophytica]MDN3593847.1 hypothetical protein [Zunongwangia endophytica]
MKKEKIPYHGASGFKVPSGYFENLEDQLCDKVLSEEEQVREIELPAEAGFKVPEAYFDGLEDRLVEKIEIKQPKLIKVDFRKTLYYAAGIAAIFICLYSTFFTLGNEQSASWDDVELSAMEDYIDDGYIDFSSTEFSNMIIEDGYIVEESDFAAMNSDAVFDYIDENVEDPSYILE